MKPLLEKAMVVIAITGTPGTGKSTLAKELSRRMHLFRLDLSQNYKSLSVGYDHNKKCYTINLKKLEDLVKITTQKHPEGVIIDSHLAHLLPRTKIDVCVVLVCSHLKTLKKRLEQRRYSSAKMRENVDAEIFQVCLQEARERGHVVVVFDTATETISSLVKKVLTEVKARTEVG